MKRLPIGRCVIALTIASAVCTPAVVGAQRPPDLDLFNVIDVGPVNVAACTCVSRPFELPEYRIDPAWNRKGPGTPLTRAPITESERAMFAAESASVVARLPEMVERALAGDGNESLALGFAVADGTGVKPSQPEAVAWFDLAARQNHLDGPALVGYRYLRGIGVPQDAFVGAQWFLIGALWGHRPSMTALGLLYAAGRGVPQNFAAADMWWARAGDDRFLADAYACGLGVPQDYQHAIALYTTTSGSFMGGRQQVAQMYRDGCGVEHDDKEAARLFRLQAEEGHPEGQVALSEMLLDGTGVEPHPDEAFVYASLAALRLPPGALRDRADKQRRAAAGFLSSESLAHAYKMIAALLAAGRSDR